MSAVLPPPELTVASLLLQAEAAEPDRAYARLDGRTVTVAELAALARRRAAALRAAGVRPGDAVATMLGNGLEHLALFFGLALAGAVWIPLNPAARGPGLAHVLGRTRPVRIYAATEALPALEEAMAAAALDPTDCAVLPTDPWEAAPAEAVAVEPHIARARDTRTVLFTSGTSGPPKGVIVTERMMLASAAGSALAAEVEPGDVFLLWEPLYHIGGAQTAVMALLHPALLALVPHFSASRLWPTARAEGVTKLHYLGGVLDILLKAPPALEDRDHKVRLAYGAGCRPEAWRAFESRFGVQIREVYGMTEASSFTTINASGAVGAIGKAAPWFDVALLDETGAEVPDGQIGEITVTAREPGLLTPGYLGDTDATARLLRGERLHTGDLGRRDATGDFHFVGRLTDSLRRRGENVSAWEVETALSAHPDIAEAAVVGVAAEIGEQEILVFVQLRDGADFDPAALDAWSRRMLPKAHQPRYWKQVARFERTPSQRIRKDALERGLGDAWDTDGG